jgi:hypothetical protein
MGAGRGTNGPKEKNNSIFEAWSGLVWVLYLYYFTNRGGTVVKVLCYKSEGR